MAASVIGIDLGTSFSAVAVIDETGRPKIVPNKDNSHLTPSCVVEISEGVMEVGEYARRQWGNAPETAAARFKRDMGTSAKFSISGREFTPTQLSTFVLKRLVNDASARIGAISEAVITIPANFAHEAREATLVAAKAAGLNVKYIINEPTAAALYYAFKHGRDLNGTYAVYDLGGGTFDISIIRMNGQQVDVIASNGIAKLGGDDFDAALQGIVQRKYKDLTGRFLPPDEFTKNAAEIEKKSLSNRKQITIRTGRQLIDVTREEFEEAISSLIAQAEMLCEATLEEAKLKPADIQSVLLAGGSTRVPVVQESVERVFGQPPVSTENVDEVVALGAALYSAYKADRMSLSSAQRSAVARMKLSETTGKCFGTLAVFFDEIRNQPVLRNSILIAKGEKIPCSVTKPFYTVREGQTAVECQVTESTAPETDPRFVKIIWRGELSLPAGRPSEQEIKVTFSYDENQVMKCSFVDVATSRTSQVDLSMSAAKKAEASEVEKFLVE
jgi:molecular chaperone DnaK